MKGVIWLIVLIVIVIIAMLFLGGDENVSAMEQPFEITINNLSDSQPLSPGVIVIHTDRFNLDYEGSLIPDELESLGEYGDNTTYLAFAEGARGVEQVINIDAPIAPGASRTFEVSVSTEDDDLMVSVVQMLVATNDGIAVVASESLFEEGETALESVGRSFTVEAVNYDAGTEENEEPGSGFEGGQPDPTRGEENIENGTATDPQEEVAPHEQVTDSVLEMVVVAGEPVLIEDEDNSDEEDNTGATAVETTGENEEADDSTNEDDTSEETDNTDATEDDGGLY